jgi:hypothetical protein
VGNGRFFLRWEVGWGRPDGGDGDVSWMGPVSRGGEKQGVLATNAVSYDVGWKMA